MSDEAVKDCVTLLPSTADALEAIDVIGFVGRVNADLQAMAWLGASPAPFGKPGGAARQPGRGRGRWPARRVVTRSLPMAMT